MARDQSDPTPIESRDELVAWFDAGRKPASDFRIGTEHEKFGFYEHDLAPVPYEGPARHQGLLEGLRRAHRLGADHRTAPHIIGLFDPNGGGAISLEPGGQFELSGAPLETLHETEAELRAHLDAVQAWRGRSACGSSGSATAPLWTLAETPVMPKQRYGIMRATCRRSARAAST